VLNHHGLASSLRHSQRPLSASPPAIHSPSADTATLKTGFVGPISGSVRGASVFASIATMPRSPAV